MLGMSFHCLKTNGEITIFGTFLKIFSCLCFIENRLFWGLGFLYDIIMTSYVGYLCMEREDP